MSVRPNPAQPNGRAPLLTLDEIAQHLRVHTSQVLRHVSAGLPCVDLSAVHRPGARPKRLLRFDVGAVEAWLARRKAPAGSSR